MLRLLRIRNLAVIEAVEVELEPGFNVLTGETGAGKSILVEAVGLLLGARASADLVRTGEAQATIEAIFEDADRGEVIVRREVTSQGRSRSFINGTLATAGSLRELSDRLVELHGQHEHQSLLDPAVASAAGRRSRRARPLTSSRSSSAWTAMRTAAGAARPRANGRPREGGSSGLDRVPAWRDRKGGIEEPGKTTSSRHRSKCSPMPNEFNDSARSPTSTLYESDQAVLSGLAQVWKRVGELASIEPKFADQLDDAGCHQVAARGHGLLVASLRRRNRRLARAPAAGRGSTGTARASEAEVRSDVAGGDRDRGGACAGAGHVDAFGRGCRGSRPDRSTRRGSGIWTWRAISRAGGETAAKQFAAQVEAHLAQLAMARTRFEVRFGRGDADEEPWGERGIDQAEFFVSPNVGEDLEAAQRVSYLAESCRE